LCPALAPPHAWVPCGVMRLVTPLDAKIWLQLKIKRFPARGWLYFGKGRAFYDMPFPLVDRSFGLCTSLSGVRDHFCRAHPKSVYCTNCDKTLDTFTGAYTHGPRCHALKTVEPAFMISLIVWNAEISLLFLDALAFTRGTGILYIVISSDYRG
jgi:hypothetical protein